MYIINVSPITRSVRKPSLRYFSKTDMHPYTLVEIPMRGRSVPAIVLSTTEVENVKSELRSADYKLKKIQNPEAFQLFQPAFLQAAHEAAAYHATSAGAIVKSLTPARILNNPTDHTITVEGIADKPYEKSILQAQDNDRMRELNSLIRETFADGRSLYICVPTHVDIERIVSTTTGSMRDYIYTLHGGLSDTDFEKRREIIQNEKHPVAVVGTPQILSLPRSDIGVIVIERDGSPHYTLNRRPYVDVRVFAELFAKHLGARIIFSDTLVHIKHLWEFQEGDMHDFYPPEFRYITDIQQELVDMRDYPRRKKHEIRILSDPVRAAVKSCAQHGKKMLLYTTRPGAHPSTICEDCGTMVTCPNCETPLVLYENKTGRNIFRCHICSYTKAADDTCRECGSWKLQPLGIGLDLVEKRIREHFPDIPVYKIDTRAAASKKQVGQILDDFENVDSGLLLTTQKGVNHFHGTVETVAVITIDSLLAIPDIGINEHIARTLMDIRRCGSERFIVQTRKPGREIFEWVIRGNMRDLYRNEIKDREQFDYPPFSTLIKITRSGKTKAVRDDMRYLRKRLEEYKPRVYPAFTPHPGKERTAHALIKVDNNRWPDKDLLSILYSLSPAFAINVNPESLL